MNKRKLVSTFLIVTAAALSFTACGKKKDKVTTNKTTAKPVDPEPEKKNLNSYYPKNDMGLAGIDVRSDASGKLSSITIVPLSFNASPIPLFIQPITDNNGISKIKVSTFYLDEVTTYFSQVYDVTSDGKMFPTELALKDDLSEDEPELLFKSDNGKLCIYNSKASITVDKDANVTVSGFETAKSSYKVGNRTVKYNNGVYSYYYDAGMTMNVYTDPKNAKLEVSAFAPYLNKSVVATKYEMDVTNDTPVAKTYTNSNSVYSWKIEEQQGAAMFNEGKLLLTSVATATLDDKGNVTKCALSSEIYGASDEVEFKYDDGKLKAVLFTDHYDNYKKYSYTYDNKGRIKTFSDGLAHDSGTNKGEYISITENYTKITYGEYNSFGYVPDITRVSYDGDGYISGEKYEYTYANNLMTEKKDNYYNDSTTSFAPTTKMTYDYDANKNIKEHFYYKYIDGVIDPSETSKTVYTYNNYTLTKEECSDSVYDGSKYNFILSTITTYFVGQEGDYYVDKEVYEELDYETQEALRTETKLSKFLDADMNYLVEIGESEKDNLNRESYDKTVFEYNSDNQITSIKEIEKYSDSITEYTDLEVTYTYDNKAIKKVNYKYDDYGTDIEEIYAYNTSGLIANYEELKDGAKYSKVEYTYDANNNLTRQDGYSYNDTLNKYVYQSFMGTVYFAIDNMFVPNGVSVYKYADAYEYIEKIVTTMFVGTMYSSITASETTTCYDGEKITDETIKTYYNNETNYKHEETVKEYDSEERITSEEYFEFYDKATETEKVYYKLDSTYTGNVKTTTGIKYTYAEDGSTITATYDWNDTTGTWVLRSE